MLAKRRGVIDNQSGVFNVRPGGKDGLGSECCAEKRPYKGGDAVGVASVALCGVLVPSAAVARFAAIGCIQERFCGGSSEMGQDRQG